MMENDNSIKLTDVKGVSTDMETRCAHYHSSLDIIAIKFACCHHYYACIHCHEEISDHVPGLWPANERNTRAILCGSCRYEMTIEEYLGCGYQCPSCKSLFNPKCSNHNHFYFEQ